MKHVRSLGFEALEARELLSRGLLAVAHAAPAPTGPLVLNGTLRVDYNPQRSSLIRNFDGSQTRTVPVAGQLQSLGRVHGTWSESVDTYGNYDGPDTLRVGNSRGTITVTFFNHNPGADVKRRRSMSYVHAQQVLMGTRAYAGASETGTIVLTTRPEHTRAATLTLHTAGT